MNLLGFLGLYQLNKFGESMEQVYCRYCNYNPCICGQRKYMTERERERQDRKDYEERWKEDVWAIPDDPREDSNWREK
jgi:hypothetical protein